MRLIDADVLERRIMAMPEDELCGDCCYNVVNVIDSMPNIATNINVPNNNIYDDEIKLKPCPLCGREVEWRNGMIMCWCGIRFKDRNYISTVESWNKRNCCGNEDED